MTVRFSRTWCRDRNYCQYQNILACSSTVMGYLPSPPFGQCTSQSQVSPWYSYEPGLDYLLLAAVWFGPLKPDMSTLLTPVLSSQRATVYRDRCQNTSKTKASTCKTAECSFWLTCHGNHNQHEAIQWEVWLHLLHRQRNPDRMKPEGVLPDNNRTTRTAQDMKWWVKVESINLEIGVGESSWILMSSVWERIWAKSGEVREIPSATMGDFNYFPSVLIFDHCLVMSRHLRMDSSG